MCFSISFVFFSVDILCLYSMALLHVSYFRDNNLVKSESSAKKHTHTYINMIYVYTFVWSASLLCFFWWARAR